MQEHSDWHNGCIDYLSLHYNFEGAGLLGIDTTQD